MKAQNTGLILGVAIILAGCASDGGNAARQDTLNERSDRIQALDDRLPPNPNRPADTRDQKSTPVVVQHDPAQNEPAERRADKGLATNAGVDQLVKAQDPRLAANAPAIGGPAPSQSDTVTLADSDLAVRVKEAISNLSNHNPNADPEVVSRETNGEAKALQNLEVTAKNGLVTLSGSVASEAERSAMEQAAVRVKGVTSVNNYLTVSKPEKQ